MPKPATRGSIDPFFVMEVMKAAAARQAAGGDVIHMEVGQPSTPAPRKALEAVERALRTQTLGYTDALGIPPLREAIARHYKTYYGVSVPAERIVVTTGSSGAFLFAFLAAFEVGARVALTEPGYPAYRNIMQALGIEVVPLPARAEAGFQANADLLEKAGRIDGLLVASPANPTGTMLNAAELRRLVEACRLRDAWLVVDEIYHGITYGGRAETVLSVTDDAIVVNSFSKYFSMTGWRLGWLVVPPSLLRAVECIAQNFTISPPAVSQVAGLGALEAYEELDGNVARYARNRAVLLEELPRAGLDRLAPADGAFYIYADVSRFTNDSPAFAARMLAETGIAATPGIDFDPAEGKRYLRFSFAGATEDMIEAAARLRRWIK